MIPLWFFVALVAELLWVSGNLIDKYLIERYFRTEEKESGGVGTLTIFSALFSFAIILFVLIVAGDSIIYTYSVASFGITIGILNGIWVLCYLYALERTELSRVVPLFQIIPIFGLLFAFILLKEVLSPLQIISSTLIIIGAIILSYHVSDRGSALDWRTILLMFAASLIVAFSETLFKVTALDFNYWSTAFWMSIGTACFGIIIYLVIPSYRSQFNSFIQQKDLGVFGANAFNEVVDSAATLVFAFAIILGPIALVQTINAYQPLLILFASFTFAKIAPDYFSEETTGITLLQKIAGIVIITAGSLVLYTTF